MSKSLPEDFVPETLPALKRLARQLKKQHAIAHHEALRRAAVRAGYMNFAEAQQKLPAATPPAKG